MHTLWRALSFTSSLCFTAWVFVLVLHESVAPNCAHSPRAKRTSAGGKREERHTHARGARSNQRLNSNTQAHQQQRAREEGVAGSELQPLQRARVAGPYRQRWSLASLYNFNQCLCDGLACGRFATFFSHNSGEYYCGCTSSALADVERDPFAGCCLPRLPRPARPR